MIGVYILIKDFDVLYVGRSLNVIRRLYSHRHKEYDYYVIIESKNHRLKWLETAMISILKPKLNRIQNWFNIVQMQNEFDYLKNFKTRRSLVLFPSGSDKYYMR